MVFAASRSSAVTDISRCSSRVSSILLWLMPVQRLHKHHRRRNPRARNLRRIVQRSGRQPVRRCPTISRIASSQNSISLRMKRHPDAIFQMRDHSTVQFSSAANCWLLLLRLAIHLRKHLRIQIALVERGLASAHHRCHDSREMSSRCPSCKPHRDVSSQCGRISSASFAAAASASRRAFIGVEPECASCP